jgi:hypothetical protein
VIAIFDYSLKVYHGYTNGDTSGMGGSWGGGIVRCEM